MNDALSGSAVSGSQECTAQGCRAELSTPYLDICGACRCGTLTAVGLALLALLFG